MTGRTGAPVRTELPHTLTKHLLVCVAPRAVEQSGQPHPQDSVFHPASQNIPPPPGENARPMSHTGRELKRAMPCAQVDPHERFFYGNNPYAMGLKENSANVHWPTPWALYQVKRERRYSLHWTSHIPDSFHIPRPLKQEPFQWNVTDMSWGNINPAAGSTPLHYIFSFLISRRHVTSLTLLRTCHSFFFSFFFIMIGAHSCRLLLEFHS